MKNYPFYTVEKTKDFNAYVEKIAEKHRGKPAICYYTAEGAPVVKTYDELTADVYALAEDLADRGLKGKHIAILSQNSYMFVVSFLAITYIGSVAVPIDQEQMPDTIKSLISFADCELVFVSDVILNRIGNRDIFENRPLIMLSDDKNIKDGFYKAVSHGGELIESQGRKCKGAAIDPNQTAVIIYTSGTTSISKPVMLSHRAILGNAYSTMQLVSFPARMFTSLPLNHSYGISVSLVNNLANGAELCINGDIRYMLRDFMLFKPEGMTAVPLIAEMLLKELIIAYEKRSNTNIGFPQFIKKISKGPEKSDKKLEAFKEAVFPGLKYIICGGAYLSANVAKALHKFGIIVLEGYGITECGPMVSGNRNEYYKRETVGLLSPAFEIKIEGGEILLRGECLMNGYYKREDLTEEAIADDWFKTGDLGYVDNDGFLIISGRKKNTIVLKNGKNISPEELENTLSEIPMVKEVMVYGSSVGNTLDDVVPAVTIYPNPAETKGMSAFEILTSIQASVDEINKTLPAYKQIRHINIRETEFPKTSTKKIKRS